MDRLRIPPEVVVLVLDSVAPNGSRSPPSVQSST